MESYKQEDNDVVPCEHHVQGEICTTRPPYRQGKEFKAVKVYTINDESQHILIQNVPSIGLVEEVKRLASKHGKVSWVRILKDYPANSDFTHAYYVKYRFLRDARQAKKKLDNRSFFGNLLHVCYAPELESVEECRRKLHERIHSIQKNPNVVKTRRFEAVGSQNLEAEIPSSTSSISSSSNPTGTWYNLLPSTASTIVPKR